MSQKSDSDSEIVDIIPPSFTEFRSPTRSMSQSDRSEVSSTFPPPIIMSPSSSSVGVFDFGTQAGIGSISVGEKRRSEDSKVSSKVIKAASSRDVGSARFSSKTSMVGTYLINVVDLVNALSTVSVCSRCKEGELTIFKVPSCVVSATLLKIMCRNCNHSTTIWSVFGEFGYYSGNSSCGSKVSSGISNTAMEKRMDIVAALAGRLIGLNTERLNLYHKIMNFPPLSGLPVMKQVHKDILTAVEFVANDSMYRAAQAISKPPPPPSPSSSSCSSSVEHNSVIVSYDGAYPRKGSSSKMCFGSVVSVHKPYRVLGYEVGCTSCREYTIKRNQFTRGDIEEQHYLEWKTNHSTSCYANYPNTPIDQVESELAIKLVTQAMHRGIIFSGLVCDGDNDTFRKLREAEIYRSNNINVDIREYECVKHVSWYLVKTLYAASKEKLSYRTCGIIGQLYFKAVSNNKGNIDEMIIDINSIPNLIQDEEEMSNETIALISDFLTENRFNSSELLERMILGFNTNINESVHRMLFRMIPKSEVITYEYLRIAAALVVIRFNDGTKGLIKVFEYIGIHLSPHILEYFEHLDNQRDQNAKRQSSLKQERVGPILKRRGSEKSQRKTRGYKSGEYTFAKPLSSCEVVDLDSEGSDSEEFDVSEYV